MKAIVARDFAPLDKLDYADWPEPAAGKGQIVIQAEAMGVNFPDGLLVQGLYQMRPEPPFVPGMETAGTVVAVGEGVEGFAIGDRAASMMPMGGYAEKVAVPAAAALKLPAGMDAADACALLVGYSTSHHALKQRAQLQPGETLCVLGAAGLTGLAAIQIGKVMGARVIAVASSDEKRRIAKENGADEVLGYENLKDELKRVTGGKGVDVAFDPVGGEAFDALSRSMAWNGRLLVIGFASGTIPKLPVNLTLVKGYSVVGVFWGDFTRREPKVFAGNLKELLGWYGSGAIRPLIEGRFALKDAPDVLHRVLNRGATGKIVLVP
ncbi:MAG: NADPH:quinone oxidoreductase family protein [Notoacmeibacter sp.]|nr:NADPH:quinone oxidoreductase family protein [Notoacmeibacter sp.]